MDPASKRKHIIITPGRTGSSLLSAILMDAGADFGLEPQKDWDERAGAFEHTLAQKAGRSLERAYQISARNRQPL